MIINLNIWLNSLIYQAVFCRIPISMINLAINIKF